MNLSKVSVFFLLLIALNVHGQTWEVVAESEKKTTYSYDPASVKRAGEIVTFWELVDYSAPLKSGKLTIRSSRTKIIQDCKNKRFKVADLIDYSGHNGTGAIVNVELVKMTGWYQNLPDSINDAFREKVCK